MTGLAEITERLPYRYPMLLVDRVLEVVPGRRLTALKAVTAGELWFRGHPRGGGPATVHFPPVLLMESLCQAAGLLAAWESPMPSVRSGNVMLLGSLADVVLRGAVEPGAVLHHRVDLLRDLGNALVFSGVSTVDETPVLTVGRMIMAIRPAGLYHARATGTAATP